MSNTIELSELRLKNFLSYKGQNVWVSKLSFAIDDEYQELIGVTPEGRTKNLELKWDREFSQELKRIPLTREWLKRMDFEATSQTEFDYYILTLSVDQKDSPLFLGKEMGNNEVFLGLRHKSSNRELRTGVLLQYVHEVQNLYYKLMKRDIKIFPLERRTQRAHSIADLPSK